MGGSLECRAGGVGGPGRFLGKLRVCSKSLGFPDCSQQLMRGLLGRELGMQCLQHGRFHCLSHGTGQRREGVCHSCCVQEQGRGAVRTPTSGCWLEHR